MIKNKIYNIYILINIIYILYIKFNKKIKKKIIFIVLLQNKYNFYKINKWTHILICYNTKKTVK